MLRRDRSPFFFVIPTTGELSRPNSTPAIQFKRRVDVCQVLPELPIPHLLALAYARPALIVATYSYNHGEYYMIIPLL